jgi:predicted HicB family RNase H-like nuclease
MKFDPEAYTITIRKEEDDGEILYVGRVAEFPNISAFEETFDAARELIIDSIQTLKRIADETHADFPQPYPVPSDEFSGRVTLRLPKTLHAKVSKIAAQEDVSVNQYLVTAVATYVGETDGISRVVSEAANLLGHIVTNAVTAANSWVTSQILSQGVTPIYISKLPVGLKEEKLPSYQAFSHTGVTQNG